MAARGIVGRLAARVLKLNLSLYGRVSIVERLAGYDARVIVRG
jgi:hypothetical protein